MTCRTTVCRWILTGLLGLAGLYHAGCTPSRIAPETQPAPPAAPPATAPAPRPGDYLSKSVVRDGGEEVGAVESVVILNQKLTYAQEKLAAVQAENKKLSDLSARQGEELQRVKTELAIAQKELADANEMLKEMRTSLDKWKTDVLGFRDEMRSAQKAQLDAMAKMLMLLSGEAPPPPKPAGKDAPEGATREKAK